MSEPVKIEKTIYSLQDFNNAVDTNFRQLIRTQPTAVSTPDSTEQSVANFFEQYNALFFDIPLSGSDESHLELATRSLEYIGVSLDDLTTEISNLREENIELKNQILLSSQIDLGTQI